MAAMIGSGRGCKVPLQIKPAPTWNPAGVDVVIECRQKLLAPSATFAATVPTAAGDRQILYEVPALPWIHPL